jgi:type II restriction enzyme
MDLFLNPDIALSYKSESQKSRIITERWFEENLYCPACPSEQLGRTPPNEKVVDFICPKCDERFQMKAQGYPFGNKVMDSAYEPKIQSIQTGTIPNFVFMHYDRHTMRVEDLMVIPKHFLTPKIIEKRPPLKPTAQRAGWVGSNILLWMLPLDARLSIVRESKVVPQEVVRGSWKKFVFMQDMRTSSRGWLNDVLSALRKIGKREFSLAEIYAFERELAKLHADNRHVKDKIRQQLQLLRDKGILDFLGEGEYSLRS